MNAEFARIKLKPPCNRKVAPKASTIYSLASLKPYYFYIIRLFAPAQLNPFPTVRYPIIVFGRLSFFDGLVHRRKECLWNPIH